MNRLTPLIFARGEHDTSNVNQKLLSLMQALPSECIHNLSSIYPDYQISLEQELALLSIHDDIVLQFRVYWYSIPAILKAWLDAVCSSPTVIAKRGVLVGKSIKALATAGSDLGRLQVSQEFTARNIFCPIEQTARYLDMQWLPPKMLNRVSK